MFRESRVSGSKMGICWKKGSMLGKRWSIVEDRNMVV